MPEEKLYWGEIHTHTALSDGNGSPEENFQIARSHLDFWAMADHAYDPEVFNFDYRTRGPAREILNDRWGEVQDLCRSHEDPGRFIPLLAYEWTNYRYGHHNVYYLDYDQPIRMPPTLPELYDSLRNVEALVIPHHGGYPVGICGKDWDFHDDDLSPFVEIYSLHGSSEEPDGIRPLLTPGELDGARRIGRKRSGGPGTRLPVGHNGIQRLARRPPGRVRQWPRCHLRRGAVPAGALAIPSDAADIRRDGR